MDGITLLLLVAALVVLAVAAVLVTAHRRRAGRILIARSDAPGRGPVER